MKNVDSIIDTIISDVAYNIEGLMTTLAYRWIESSRTDIKAYAALIVEAIPNDWRIVKMTKHPFGFIFNIGDAAEYHMFVTGDAIYWKRTK